MIAAISSRFSYFRRADLQLWAWTDYAMLFIAEDNILMLVDYAGTRRIASVLTACARQLVCTPAASPFLTEQFRARSRGGTKTRAWNFQRGPANANSQPRYVPPVQNSARARARSLPFARALASPYKGPPRESGSRRSR